MIYLKDLLPEIEFASQEEFQAYDAKHKMRPTTKVKIAGKDTTAGDAAGATKKPKKKFPPKPGIDIPYKKDSIQATRGGQDGPQSPEDAIGTDPAYERAIIAGVKNLIKTGKDADLCNVSVPGTNLFCGGNKGIPRKEMPQLKSKPIPGGPADKLVKQGKLQMDDGGEVNTEELFLKSIGKEAKVERVNVSNLKATQNQIDGPKVSLFLNQLLNGSPDDGFTKALNEPIIVSEDGYVVDGHHRWAALVAYDISNGGSGDVEMNVKRVEMGIEPLIQKSNGFTKKMGLEVKTAGKKK